MAAVEYEITGAENLIQIFEQLPEKYGKKPVVATFRKAAAIFTKQLKQATPQQTGDTKKAIKVKALRGTALQAGFAGGSSYFPAYMKAYWINYGTYANRDSAHQFKQRRKSKTATWKGGIRAKKFVEASWDQTKSQVENTINTELESETLKFLNKYRVD